MQNVPAPNQGILPPPMRLQVPRPAQQIASGHNLAQNHAPPIPQNRPHGQNTRPPAQNPNLAKQNMGRANHGKHNVPPMGHPPQPDQPTSPNIAAASTLSQHKRVGFSRTSLNSQSGRWMMVVTTAFLFFYILLVTANLFNDHNASKKTARDNHSAFVKSGAEQISTAIDNNLLWMNNGLGQGKNPAQSAKLIAKSPNISSAIILNQKNQIIARSRSLSKSMLDAIGKISLKGIANNDIKVSSIIEENGYITPIIIKKTGNYFAVASLNKDVLINLSSTNSTYKTALVTSSGRIIDGDVGLGKAGALDWFNLSTAQLNSIIVSKSASLENLKIQDTRYRLASRQIPNSNSTLILLEARPNIDLEGLTRSIILFTILFLGTCALVGLLLNTVYKQLHASQSVRLQTEISQQRYQAAIEGDRGGIWELDIPNNSAYLSASLASLLGMPRRDHHLTTSQFLDLFHPQERENFLSIIRRAHIQGEFDIDISVARLPLILQCRGRPSTRTGNDFKRVIVGVALDITEQRRAQIRLKSTEERLHNALSSMTDSFAVWDNTNRLVLWNIRFAEFFGFLPGELQPGMEHVHVDFLTKPAVDKIIKDNEHEGWSEVRLTDGRWIRYIETTIEEGGRVSIGTDITEIRMREAELNVNETTLQNTVNVLRKSQESILELAERYEQEKIRAEEANQSKTDFLASMSHELRTPLNAINGFSDIMKKEMFGPLGDPRYKDYINDILFSGQHLLTLINDILDMSKIEAGKMTLNTEILFMDEMVAQVVRIIRGRAEEAQLTLNIETPKTHEIEADPRAVKQILLNLVTNAIKFTPEGGTVGVQVIDKKSGIIIKIKDSGIGISEENIERLAKPFEQVTNNGHQHQEGTGLGLALSKSLIELHGGNFKIESVLGEGTTVTFSLPNKPIEREDDTAEDDVSQEISRLAQDIANVLATDVTAPIDPQTEQPLEPIEKQAAQLPYEQPEFHQPTETVSNEQAYAAPPPLPNPYAA